MAAIISSFFTNNGDPALGLTPTLRVWEVDEVSHTNVVLDAAMVEVGDGFYKYVFTAHDAEKTYSIRTDGGAALPIGERYGAGVIDEEISGIREAVWDAPALDHTAVGSMGLKINQICADTAALTITADDIETLVTTLLKYECNRTRIDKDAKTLTVYDDDGLTPIKVFNLQDGTGTPSVEEVCERDPI